MGHHGILEEDAAKELLRISVVIGLLWNLCHGDYGVYELFYSGERFITD